MALALTRRRLLTMGVGLAAAGAGGGLAFALGPAAPGARVLGRWELDVVEAVASTLFAGGPLDAREIAAEVVPRVDAIVADLLDTAHAMAFRYVLRTLELGTLASRGAAFTALSEPERREVLDTWVEPEVLPRRLAGDSLRGLLGMAYFGHPRALAAIGWTLGCGDAQ